MKNKTLIQTQLEMVVPEENLALALDLHDSGVYTLEELTERFGGEKETK